MRNKPLEVKKQRKRVFVEPLVVWDCPTCGIDDKMHYYDFECVSRVTRDHRIIYDTECENCKQSIRLILE